MKYVSAAEFKAKCLKLMDEVQAGGEPITVTKRGKPVVTLLRAKPANWEPRSLLGALASPKYRFVDPDGPLHDGPWDAEK
jgi:prevent-host-death family protein